MTHPAIVHTHTTHDIGSPQRYNRRLTQGASKRGLGRALPCTGGHLLYFMASPSFRADYMIFMYAELIITLWSLTSHTLFSSHGGWAGRLCFATLKN